MKNPLIVVILNTLVVIYCNKYDKYLAIKENLTQIDDRLLNYRFDNLTKREKIANDYIMDLKKIEAERDFSKNYFILQKNQEDSKLLKWIRKMPKGALLHVDDFFLHSPDYLLKLTYDFKDLYYCLTSVQPIFRFSLYYPEWQNKNDNPCKPSKWRKLEDERKNRSSQIDRILKKNFYVIEKYRPKKDHDKKALLLKMKRYNEFILPLITYEAVWEKYLADALRNIIADGAIYVEIRTSLPYLYGKMNETYKETDNAKKYKKVIKALKDDNPNFLGAKIIYAPMAAKNKKELHSQLRVYHKIHKKIPGLLAGFDQVWPEHSKKSLMNHASILVERRIRYLFNAGQTTTTNSIFDQNIIDALALKAKRLNNVFSLAKHPKWMSYIKKHGITSEISIISNQQFFLVKDLRDHPLAIYLAKGLRVVLTGDKFNIWRASPVSDEFFLAFVAVANYKADLRFLKGIARNSLVNSNFKGKLRNKAMEVFDRQWKDFIETIVPYSIRMKNKERSPKKSD